jgi:hypothetical protein
MKLNLLLPGLIWPEPTNVDYIYQNIKLVNFNQILKKANLVVKSYSYSDLIYQLNLKQLHPSLNFATTTNIASIYAQYLNLENTYKSFLMVEPTHLRLNNVDLQISQSDLLQLNEDEAKDFISQINNFYNGELKLYFLTTNLWLLGHNLELNSEINFYPILDIIGENINDFLPSGKNSIQLNKIINEIQMLLFNSPTNQVRQEHGDIILNSIWLWNKKINSSLEMNYTNIFTNQDTLLHQSNNNYIQAIPKNLDDLMQNNSLIIIDCLFYSSCYRDNYSYTNDLEQLDQTLGQFLQQKINQKQIHELNILVPLGQNTIQLCTIPLNKYKFWRNRSLIHFIKEYHAR